MGSNERFLSAECGIIIAADVPSLDELDDLIALVCQVPEVSSIKIGFTLVIRYGLDLVVKRIKEACDISVIYDHQKAATDIPEMGGPFAEACRDAGVESVIFFPHAGPRTLEAFVSAALVNGLIPIVGLVMTHDAYLQSEGGYIVDNAPELICRTSVDIGVRHYVLPGNKTKMIRTLSTDILAAIQPATIVMPGIGAQGGTISAAFQAASGHRPFAIIGSAIYKAQDPKSTLERFAEEVRSWNPN